jgi:uncharacterized membrane protein
LVTACSCPYIWPLIPIWTSVPAVVIELFHFWSSVVSLYLSVNSLVFVWICPHILVVIH